MSLSQYIPQGLLNHPEYGDVILYKHASFQWLYLIQKTEKNLINEKKTAYLSTLENRSKISHENLLSLCSYQYGEKDKCMRIFFEYSPYRSSEMKFLKIEAAYRWLFDVLKCLTYLNQINFIHGDFRPEYVMFFPDQNIFKVADKFANFKDPISNLKNCIKEGRDLFCSPKFFNDFLQKKFVNDFKYSPFKNESFSAGMACLKIMYGKSLDLKEFYQVKQGMFNSFNLIKKMQELCNKSKNEKERLLLAFIAQNLVCYNELTRLTAETALEKFKKLLQQIFPNVQAINLNIYDLEFSDNMQVLAIVDAEETTMERNTQSQLPECQPPSLENYQKRKQKMEISDIYSLQNRVKINSQEIHSEEHVLQTQSKLQKSKNVELYAQNFGDCQKIHKYDISTLKSQDLGVNKNKTQIIGSQNSNNIFPKDKNKCLKNSSCSVKESIRKKVGSMSFDFVNKFDHLKQNSLQRRNQQSYLNSDANNIALNNSSEIKNFNYCEPKNGFYDEKKTDREIPEVQSKNQTILKNEAIGRNSAELRKKISVIDLIFNPQKFELLENEKQQKMTCNFGEKFEEFNIMFKKEKIYIDKEGQEQQMISWRDVRRGGFKISSQSPPVILTKNSSQKGDQVEGTSVDPSELADKVYSRDFFKLPQESNKFEKISNVILKNSPVLKKLQTTSKLNQKVVKIMNEIKQRKKINQLKTCDFDKKQKDFLTFFESKIKNRKKEIILNTNFPQSTSNKKCSLIFQKIKNCVELTDSESLIV